MLKLRTTKNTEIPITWIGISDCTPFLNLALCISSIWLFLS